MPEIAFVNGEFMPLEQAVVPIEDRGFQFADGVYEVLATYCGEMYALEAHFERLERSLRELRLPFDLRAYGLEEIVKEGIDYQGFCLAEIPESAEALRLMRYYRALWLSLSGIQE